MLKDETDPEVFQLTQQINIESVCSRPNNLLLCLRLSLSSISVERSERYYDTLRLTGIVNKEDAKGHLDANLIKHAASYYLLGLEIPNPQHYSIKTSHSQTVVLKEKMWKAFN